MSRPEEDRAYRDRIRGCLADVDESVVSGWEAAGHLPADRLRALGATGAFRERWRPGAEDGLPRLVALADETAQVCSGLALAVLGHCEVFTGGLHRLAATDEQRALRDAALDGEVLGCFAATEPQGGSDLTAVRSTATRVDGGWRLTGRKRYVSNLGGSTHALVLARDADRSAARDLGLFVLPLDTPGVRIEGFFATAGLRSCDVGEMSFDTVVGLEAALGGAGMGLLHATQLLQFERLAICIQLATAARLALRLAAAYARRRTIGDARLLDKQVLRHRLAVGQAELWAVEAAIDDVVRRARRGEGVGHRVAALKLVAGAMAEQVTDGCLQIFGARGYTSNYPLERYWRDVRLARIGGGPDEVMAELVASRIDRPDPDGDSQLDRIAAADQPR